MNRDKWPLIALAVAPRQRLSPVQLQKALFLIGQYLPRTREDAFYQFQPYHYGPFDSQVYQDASAHIAAGLVDRVPSPRHDAGDFQLTPAGMDQASQLIQEIPENEQTYLNDLLRWITSLNFRELVTAVYKAFPDFKVNSVFQD